MAAADEPLHGAAGNQASDAENADPAEAGSLRKMFVQGTEAIQTKRTDNLFQSLEERTLTDEEQRIIEQRVALQRKMFEEYERRERKRKVAELQDVCPDISEAEAEKALDLCDGREDEAAAQLVSDAGFRLRVQAACGLIAEELAAPAATAAAPPRREGSSRSHRRSKPAGPRPKLVDPATLSSTVFVGAFRGKGFKPPPKGRQPARKTANAAAAKAAAASNSAGDEETETEDEREHEEQEEQQGAADQQQQQEEPGQQQQQQQQQVSPPEQQQQQPALAGVLLWPQAQAAPQPAAVAEPQLAAVEPAAAPAEPQRYVLVRADTLEAPSDSLLRSSRRQLGEPSDSRVPLGTDATDAAMGGEPASVARSRPLPAVAEEEQQELEQEQEQGQQEQLEQGQPQQEAAQQEQRSGEAEGGQGGAAQPSAAALAAMAKQLSKLDDGKARALLRHMGGTGVREAVLEQLGALDPDRAAACFALLGDEADESEEAEDWGDASDDDEEQWQQPLAGQQQQQGQQQGQGDGGDDVAVEEAPSAQRARSRRAAAAGARRAVKRAASAALSDSEATETEAEPSSDEEMGEGGASSEDDDFVAPRSTRRGRAPPAKRQARPSRAAKNAAAAAFVAMAAVSGGEEGGSDADMGEADAASSDDEAVRPQRQRRGGSKSRGSRQQAASPSPAPSGAPAASGSAPPSTKRQRTEEAQPASAVAAAAFAAAAAAAAAVAGAGQAADAAGAAAQQEQQPSGSGGGAEQPPARQQRAGAAAARRTRAISATGHTCRGRVKQKSHKSADLVVAGRLRAEKGWFNAGYIFPAGFQSRTLFRSSVAIDQLCVHECHIIGEGGQFWPAPTFKVVALDRPDEPLIAKSCTGCWTGILKRINAEIEARRRAGEDLPPPPKTAIAGPEYFGLNQPNIQEAVEALDPNRLCTEYWAGKEDRLAAAAGVLPAAGGAPRAQRAQRQPAGGTRRTGGGGGGSRKGRRREEDSDSEGGEAEGEGEEDETQYMATKWSAVSRTERYRKRLEENGEDVSALDQDNPLPHFIDPITMSAVVRPAISPYGHVAGLATWKVVLAEKQQCPFTNQPLQFEQLKVLTKTNIHLWRDKIVNGPGQAPA